MKNKGALVLGGMVLLLGIYAYFGEYKREINEVASKEAENKIVALKKDQVQKIELKKGNGTPVILEKTVNGWNVLSPVQDQADNEIIEAFLDQISSEKAVDKITPKTDDLSEYGFKPAIGIITLVDNKNQKQQIEVSVKKNFEGLVFLRRDQEKEILTSSQTWTSFLTKPLDQFRNLKLFRGSISKVDIIHLENSKGKSVFRYTDGFWFSPQRTDWKIDQNAVREILTQATAAKGTAVMNEKSLGPVGAHLLTLEFGFGKGSWKGLLHQDTKTKDVIGALSPERMIIRFPPQTLEELRSKKLIDFRDKAEPFRMPNSQIQKIVAQTKLKSFVLVRNAEKNVWVLDRNDPEVVVDSTLAQNLVGNLRKMTVYKFREGSQTKKNDLNSQIQLFDEDNQLIFQMSWGDFKEHEGLAQTNLFKEVFLMDDAQINHLMLHEIVKPKPSAQEQQKENSSEKINDKPDEKN